MSTLEIVETVQRIVDLEESKIERMQVEIEQLKNDIFIKHNNIKAFQSDIDTILSVIGSLLERLTVNSKLNKDKLLKRRTYKMLEIALDSCINQEKRRRENLLSNKKEYLAIVSEVHRRLIECAGQVLEVAISSATYFPFVILLSRHLSLFSVVMDYFIPISYYPLHLMNFMCKSPSASLPLQPISETDIKVADKYLSSSVFREYVLLNCLEILSGNLIQHSISVGFPEYSSMIMTELKRIRNSPHKNSPWVNKKIEGLVRGVREHTEKIEKLREGVSVFEEELVQKIEKQIPILKISIE
ncbi:hypothetical protein NEOKW01_0852 [Nematocida sp. AWRm80]|nr:hypothetical protein NEOKW01_0852 [Nematocida sp. AWRm80]